MTTRPDTTGRAYVKRRGFTHVPNGTVDDQRMTYQALALLVTILRLPEGAPQGYRDLMGRGMGESATRKALRELGELGYRHQVRVNVGGGVFRVDTVVSEEPITEAEAAAWLAEVGARKDPPARRGHPVDNPPTVPEIPRRGVTSENTPSPQVAPRRGSPEHGGPRHGEPRHASYEAQTLVTPGANAPSVQGKDPTATAVLDRDPDRRPSTCVHADRPGMPCPRCPRGVYCDHGAERRTGCALCRAGVPG